MFRILKSLAIAAVLVAMLPLASAHAAKIEVDRDGCPGPKCITYVLIDGMIEKGDGDRFKDLIKREKVEKAVVMVRGPGGFMVDAMVIGMIVHEKGWVTFLGDDGTCVSACADIWSPVRFATPRRPRRSAFTHPACETSRR